MKSYTTCWSCRGTLEVSRLDRPNTHHLHCPPPPPDKYEKGLELFGQMVASMVAGHDPTPEQEAKFDNLRLWLQAQEDAPPRLKDAALAYVSFGWQVFPLAPLDKTPLIDHWRDNASTDVGQVHDWWDHHPDANIGLPTGLMFDVLDFDNMETYQRLQDGGGSILSAMEKRGIDIHGVVRTSRGGEHWYLKPTGSGNKADMFKKLGYPGVDYRGLGGYVVGAPSWLEAGKRWRWLVKPSPDIRVIQAEVA